MKYDKYILKQEMRDKTKEKFTPQGPPEGVFGVSGEQWAGINCNFAFNWVGEPMIVPAYPHTHTYDELLFFIGGNPTDPLDFKAEIHIALGDEWEKHIITTTCVVCIPAGLMHTPVMVMKVDEPIVFGHINVGADYLTSAPPNLDKSEIIKIRSVHI
jgi:hypothetical protein